MSYELIHTGLLQGLILALIALGIMIPFRLLKFQDLSVEAAYPLGGAVCACILQAGLAQMIAIFAGIIAGGMVSLATSQVAFKLKLNTLLAGIIVSTMVYSLNLRLMQKPNIALFGADLGSINIGLALLILIILLFLSFFYLFLHTDFGLRFRAVGQNPKLSNNYGIHQNRYTSLGLFLAGGLFGLAGSLMVQIQQFMDVGMGVGIVIHGLASLMLGEALLGNSNLGLQLMSPVIGSLMYQQIQGFALSLGLAPSDLKFFTGFIVLLILSLKREGNYAC